MSIEAHCQLAVPLPVYSHAETSDKLTIVRLLLSLLLLLLSSRGVGSSSVTTSRGATSSGGSRGTAGTDVQEHVLEVLAIEGLGKECAPDGLNIGDLGGGDERLKLVRLERERLLVHVLAHCASTVFPKAMQFHLGFLRLRRS